MTVRVLPFCVRTATRANGKKSSSSHAPSISIEMTVPSMPFESLTTSPTAMIELVRAYVSRICSIGVPS